MGGWKATRIDESHSNEHGTGLEPSPQRSPGRRGLGPYTARPPFPSVPRPVPRLSEHSALLGGGRPAHGSRRIVRPEPREHAAFFGAGAGALGGDEDCELLEAQAGAVDWEEVRSEVVLKGERGAASDGLVWRGASLFVCTPRTHAGRSSASAGVMKVMRDLVAHAPLWRGRGAAAQRS